MRIRSTKPEFWRSNTIAQLDWADRFVLKGLESYVDDNGVGKDDVELIASDVFPRDLSRNSRDTLARLSEAITRISAAGLIVRYVIDGERLLYVDKWKDIQRVDKPNRGRFRRPDGTLEYTEPVDRDSYRNPRDTLAPVTEEQGNRGTEEDDDARPEPSHRDYPGSETVVVADTPTQIVRDTVAAYPQATIIRLEKQVRNLLDEGHPVELIKKALAEWERRPKCDRPEFLPTVLSDVIKAERSGTGPTRQVISSDEKSRRAACPDCDTTTGLAEDDDGRAYRCRHPKLDT